jgi:hypothetical protein
MPSKPLNVGQKCKFGYTLAFAIFLVVCAERVYAQESQTLRKPTAEMIESNKSDSRITLDDVERTISSYSTQGNPKNIFPGLPLSGSNITAPIYDHEGALASQVIDLNEPDEIDPGGNSDFSPYSLPADYYFDYKVHSVGLQERILVTKRLEALNRSSLYGIYIALPREEMYREKGPYGIETSLAIEMSKLNRADLPSQSPIPVLRARYTRKIDLVNGTLREDGTYVDASLQILIPKTWLAELKGEHFKSVWVECAVRVDRDGIPISPPLRHLRPIALETDKGLYLVDQTAKAVTGEHGYFVQFAKSPVFKFSNDSASADNVRVIIDTYHKNLSLAFLSSPIAAKEAGPGDTFPGEFHFVKHWEKSEVLAGFSGPYKELSDYFVKWLRTDGRELYTLAPLHKGGFGATGSAIVIQAEQSLTLCVGASSEYDEPTNTQRERYMTAMNNALTTAAKATSDQFGGKVDVDGVFVIDPTKLH